jgi:hypoxanthine phosphoribosyltransferase
MKTVKIKDKTFSVFIHESEILSHVKDVAERINVDYEGHCPLFVVVLNGAFMFAADLLRDITIPCEIAFVKLSSYEGTQSTGQVKEIMGLSVDIENRDVVIVEDIVETGRTMVSLIDNLKKHKPASIKVCTLTQKPDRLEVPSLKLDYVAIKIPNSFIIGYGFDYDQQARNLRDIYSLVAENID